jgi:hypothetical protein
MSKVKGEIFDLNKTKLRGNLRRIETAKKKKQRLKNVKNNVYPYGKGYYIRNEKEVDTYTTVTIPEHEEDIYHFERRTETIWTDEGSYDITVPVKIVTGKKIVPERTVRRRIHTEWIPIPERCIHYRLKIKDYRKFANRRIRNSKEVFRNGDYKKAYDIEWQYW